MLYNPLKDCNFDLNYIWRTNVNNQQNEKCLDFGFPAIFYGILDIFKRDVLLVDNHIIIGLRLSSISTYVERDQKCVSFWSERTFVSILKRFN